MILPGWRVTTRLNCEDETLTTFDDREHAAEAHFALEEHFEFKAQMLLDRLIALWAGELLSLSGDTLEAYVGSVRRADLREPGDEDVHQKILADLADKGVHVKPHEVRERMDAFLIQARKAVEAAP